MQEIKELKQVKGKSYNGFNLNGYFIHMGDSKINEEFEPFLISQDFSDGIVKDNLIGTYLHGVFDNDAFREDLLKSLGYFPIKKNFQEFKNKEYNRLAQFVRENVDLDQIYQIISND